MTLEELLAQSVTDEAQRSQLLNAIKQDRAGLETNKQQILDELKEERKARQQQADKLKEFDGIDPAQVRAIMGRFENDEEAKLIAEGKTQEVIERKIEKVNAQHKAAMESSSKRVAELEAALAERDAKLSEIMIDNAAIQAASEFGIEGEGKLKIITMLARQAFKVEDGQPIMRDADGQIITGEKGPITQKEWIDRIVRQEHGYLLPTAKGVGSQGGKQGAQIASNPFKKDSLNLTEQARVQRENPQLAARLKAEAAA
ncbi:hypothetical protein [Stutzerimonas stutzeri]|uniref:hypothetical protein n=1 Tax=Stutzerimonas stutzeri TaxID=316 RepID=UPI00244B627B|nr:hypothetical protein [Stutzerimonas stutzeri]MDH0157350.1 hypothetical protein [Stutzerimonas stutzeri]